MQKPANACEIKGTARQMVHQARTTIAKGRGLALALIVFEPI